MSERKPREWAIDKIQCDPIDPELPSFYCAYATWTPDDEKNGRTRVREVLEGQSEFERGYMAAIAELESPKAAGYWRNLAADLVWPNKNDWAKWLLSRKNEVMKVKE